MQLGHKRTTEIQVSQIFSKDSVTRLIIPFRSTLYTCPIVTALTITFWENLPASIQVLALSRTICQVGWTATLRTEQQMSFLHIVESYTRWRRGRPHASCRWTWPGKFPPFPWPAMFLAYQKGNHRKKETKINSYRYSYVIMCMWKQCSKQDWSTIVENHVVAH